MFQSIIFGGAKGFGESILLKFSETRYGIIDSYLNPKTKIPAVIEYFNDNEINPEYVDFILLTHYHQDHFSGLSKVISFCKNARFFAPKVLISKHFQFLIAAYSKIISSQNYFVEFVEVLKILKSSNRKLLALSDISKPLINEPNLKVYPLSPNKDTFDYFDELYKERAKKYMESGNISISVGKDFNFQSIVIVIELNELTFIYGGDLEYHAKNNSIGWTPIWNNLKAKYKDKHFKMFKIPHHGSKNGYNKVDWNCFLNKESILKLSPYSRSNKLPTKKMIPKILEISPLSFITSPLKFKKIPSPLRKKVAHLDIKRITNTNGAISVSIDIDNKFEIDLFDDAQNLSDLQP